MGRKLDLSRLTDDEAEHVLKVVRRDMKLRKKEEDRLRDLKHELEEEGACCLLLAKQRGFNEQCCIRCCGPFNFFLKPRRVCLYCCYNVCKACCSYAQHENGYVCSFCHKIRLLRAQSLEWFYNNVKSRFKRFGSAKVLKVLYRKHITERKTLAELPEVNVPAVSNDNVGSACDMAISKQSESYSVAETLTVALRVAEEAIEEAISKADGYKDSLEKQNEARYLCEHRDELVEELATTIVQKIIRRGKLCSDMQTDYNFVWCQTPNRCLPSPKSSSSTCNTSQSSTGTQACRKKTWASQSALCVTTDELPNTTLEADKVVEVAEPEANLDIYSSLRRESRASILGWKNVDRLDNSSVSSVLQSPDGNWIALQTSLLSRPSLLTKRKSLVFSVLEKESGMVSAYDEMGSESEDGAEHDSWGLALLQFRQGFSEETRSSDSQCNPENYLPINVPFSGPSTNTQTLNSDSDKSIAPSTQTCAPVHEVTQKNKISPKPSLACMPYEHNRPAVRPSHSSSLGALDVNFNPQVVEDSSKEEEQAEQVRRLWHERQDKCKSSEQNHVPSGLYTGENNTLMLNTVMMKPQDGKETPSPLPSPIYQSPDTVSPCNHVTSNAITPKSVYQNTVNCNPSLPDLWMNNRLEIKTLDHELKSNLSELDHQISKQELTSSDDELVEKIIDGRYASERGKKSDKVSQRKDGAEKESKGKVEVKRTKRKMKRVSERWTEGQISKECEKSQEVRRRNRKSNQNKEADNEAERQLKKQATQEQHKIEKTRLERNQQITPVNRESDNERKVENMKYVELEPQTLVQPSGFHMRRDQQECGVQNVSTVKHERGTDEDMEMKKMEDENHQKGNFLTGELVNTRLLQRRKSERGSEKRPEVHSCNVHSDKDEQDSPTEKYSAASLCSITTEVLKVLNATEDLIGEAKSKGYDLQNSPAGIQLSLFPNSRQLDQHLSNMEESVYLAAGTVYGLEGALSHLQDCAHSIGTSTTETELAFLEDRVANAAAHVQESELQISDIEARISALKNAGLNVCSRFPRLKPQTLDASRQQRRKLPAPPAIEAESRSLQS